VLLLGATGVATYGFFPFLNVLDVAFARTRRRSGSPGSRHAPLPEGREHAVRRQEVRAIDEVRHEPAPDFLIFGGSGPARRPVELKLGAELLKELKIRAAVHPGRARLVSRHGEDWNAMFGQSPWSFDHKGVRFVVSH